MKAGLSTCYPATVGKHLKATMRASLSSSAIGRLVVCHLSTFLFGVATSAQHGSTCDPSFTGYAEGNLSHISEIVIQDDGQILVGGNFTSYQGIPRKGIARLHPDGQLDTAFDLGSGLYIAQGPPGTPLLKPSVQTIAVQPDGKILVGGVFDSVGTHEYQNLVRLLPNGAVDTDFGWLESGVSISRIALQADGRILVLGGSGPSYLFRLHADGSYDTSFSTGTGFGGISSPSCIRVQEDGRILVGGLFQSYNGVQRSGLIRLHPNGEVDDSFAIGNGTNAAVETIDLYPNGDILVGGRFTSINGVAKTSFARVFPNGEVDLSFDAGTGAVMDGSTSRIHDVCIMSDGRICVSGLWEDFQDQSFDLMACMQPNGDWDPSFGLDRPNHVIRAIVQQDDGRLLIGGSFTAYMPIAGPPLGIPNDRIARIMGGAVGVEQYDAAKGVDVFPNPAIDLVHVKVDDQGDRLLSLYNSLGQEVHQQRFTHQAMIDLSGLSAGGYQIIIRDRTGAIRGKRLLKL